MYRFGEDAHKKQPRVSLRIVLVALWSYRHCNLGVPKFYGGIWKPTLGRVLVDLQQLLLLGGPHLALQPLAAVAPRPCAHPRRRPRQVRRTAPPKAVHDGCAPAPLTHAQQRSAPLRRSILSYLLPIPQKALPFPYKGHMISSAHDTLLSANTTSLLIRKISLLIRHHELSPVLQHFTHGTLDFIAQRPCWHEW
jgi:hypothetical protein